MSRALLPGIPVTDSFDPRIDGIVFRMPYQSFGLAADFNQQARVAKL